MLVSTTNSIDGYQVANYLGVVAGENVAGINALKDLGAGLRNVFGGRSVGYEEELVRARESAREEMEQRAAQLGANAVVGFNYTLESVGQGGMLMIMAYGTAVQLVPVQNAN